MIAIEMAAIQTCWHSTSHAVPQSESCSELSRLVENQRCRNLYESGYTCDRVQADECGKGENMNMNMLLSVQNHVTGPTWM